MRKIHGFALIVVMQSVIFPVYGAGTPVRAEEAKSEVEFLVQKLKSNDRNIRQEAVRYLGQSGNRQAVPSLISVLVNDQEWLVRSLAAEALGTIGDRKSVDPLINALNDDVVAYVKVAAARALGKIRTSKAIDTLAASLASEGDWRVRIEIVSILGNFRDPVSIRALQLCAREDQRDTVRDLAASLVEKAGG